jgi:hypothetical protein
VGNWKADARRGSERLRKAILRSLKPKPKRRQQTNRYGSWEDRQLAMGQIDRLKRAVADHYGLPHRIMTGSRGVRDITEKRQVAMFLARSVIQSSYPDIAQCFGGKDHTTVLHACRAVESSPRLLAQVIELRRRMSA